MESGMPELKQNKHFTSYLTSHHQRKATKVAAHQILSDPLDPIRIPCIPCISALKHIASPVVGDILHAERDARHSCAGVGPQDERFFKNDQDVPRCS